MPGDTDISIKVTCDSTCSRMDLARCNSEPNDRSGRRICHIGSASIACSAQVSQEACSTFQRTIITLMLLLKPKQPMSVLPFSMISPEESVEYQQTSQFVWNGYPTQSLGNTELLTKEIVEWWTRRTQNPLNKHETEGFKNNDGIAIYHGLLHLISLLCMNNASRTLALEEDATYYHRFLLDKNKDIPLKNAHQYEGTPWSAFSYVKGSILFGILGIEMNRLQSNAFCDFLRSWNGECEVATLSSLIKSVLPDIYSALNAKRFLSRHFDYSSVFPQEEITLYVKKFSSLLCL
eukprot:PhF_6_TR5544/c0_g1_i2/m.7903